MIRVAFGIIACALAAAAAPLAAQSQEDQWEEWFSERLTESERAHRRDILAVLADDRYGRPTAIERLRTLISRLDPGSHAWSFVTGALLRRLHEERRMSALLATAESAIAAQPDDFSLKFEAIGLLARSPYYRQAADYWLGVAARLPEIAYRADSDVMGDLIKRLNAADEKQRAGAIAKLLFLGGSKYADTAGKSDIAAAVFPAFAETGEHELALRALDAITNPNELLAIMVDREFADYWDQVEQRAGPDFAEAYRREMAGFAADYRDEDNLYAGYKLISRANRIGLHEQVLARFLPIYEEAIERPEIETSDYNHVYWVAPLARAHLAAGDPRAAQRLYEQAAGIWKVDDGPTATNVAANRAEMYLWLGRFEESVELMDEVIAELDGNPDARESALILMHGVRIAALAELGRLDKAKDSIDFIRKRRLEYPISHAHSLIDRGLADEAVEHLLRTLHSVDYQSVLLFMQPDLLPPRTDYQRRARERYDAVRQNEALRTAFERRGRLLDRQLPRNVTF